MNVDTADADAENKNVRHRANFSSILCGIRVSLAGRFLAPKLLLSPLRQRRETTQRTGGERIENIRKGCLV